MDNNFSNILDIFKRLDEGTVKHVLELFSDWMNSEDRPYSDMAGDDRAVMGCAYRYLDGKVDPSKIDTYAELLTKEYHGDVDEGSMTSAEQHSTGPKFTGYWKGTDPRTPGQHMVGGADESVEQECAEPVSLTDKLRARWEQTKREKGLSEAGANNPAPGAQDPIQQKAMLQKTTQAGQTFQKLQNMAGIKTGVGASQAAKTAVANTQNPNINPSTGAGMDQTGKKVIGALGKGIEDALVNANPADATKLIQNIQQIKQKAAGQ